MFFAGVLGIASGVGLSVGAAAESTSTSGSSVVVIVAAIFGGGVMAAVVSAWQFKKLGGVQREELQSHAKEMETNAAALAVNAMQQSLGQRERDLAAALARIEHLETDVRSLTVKIANLEGQLVRSNGLREQVQAQLSEALSERDLLRAEIDDLNRRIGGRRADDPQDRSIDPDRRIDPPVD